MRRHFCVLLAMLGSNSCYPVPRIEIDNVVWIVGFAQGAAGCPEAVVMGDPRKRRQGAVACEVSL